MTAGSSGNAGSAKRHGGRHVYETLRRRILTLELEPGSPLDEVSLAEHFNLSRSPIRDALARLMSEGLVTVIGNRSAIVKPIDFSSLPRYIDALDLIQRAVTRLAAALRTEQDLKEIQAINQQYMDSVINSDVSGMTEYNKAFHLRISQAGGNPYLTEYYENLLDEGQRLIHLQLRYLVADLHLSIGNDHEEMLQAIVARDVVKAEEAASRHTQLFRQRFVNYLNQSHVDDLALNWLDTERETS